MNKLAILLMILLLLLPGCTVLDKNEAMLNERIQHLEKRIAALENATNEQNGLISEFPIPSFYELFTVQNTFECNVVVFEPSPQNAYFEIDVPLNGEEMTAVDITCLCGVENQVGGKYTDIQFPVIIDTKMSEDKTASTRYCFYVDTRDIYCNETFISVYIHETVKDLVWSTKIPVTPISDY